MKSNFFNEIDEWLASHIRRKKQDRKNTQITNPGNAKGSNTSYPKDVKGQ